MLAPCLLSLALAAAGPAPTLTDTEAAHLLRRAGFSARPDEVKTLVGKTREQAVDALLSQMRTTAVTPPPPSATSAFSMRKPKDKDRTALLDSVAEQTGNDVDALGPVAKDLVARAAQRGLDLKAWWIEEMIATPSPLTERVTLALHGHFTTSLKKVKDPRLVFRQNALLRAHAGGSYADLLHAVVNDPAMLLYLDASGSKEGAPNENLARELLELFTLGEGHHSEADVLAAARALTGRKVRRLDGDVVNVRRQRDAGDKVFLGVRGDLGPNDIVTTLLKHPRTAVTATEMMWRAFVSDAPDPARVVVIADAFRQSGYQMKVLLRALLLEEAFWQQNTLLRAPVDLVVAVAREHAAANAGPDAGRDLLRPEHLALSARKMGQDLFDPPNVKGWPGGTRWVTTATIVPRDRFLLDVSRALRAAGHDDDASLVIDPIFQTR